jgi:hypothetical protein
MFTDFVAECRAVKLKHAHTTKDIMGAAKVDASLRKAAQPVEDPIRTTVRPQPIAATA